VTLLVLLFNLTEGQEDQLGALGLVVNVMILWKAIDMNAAIEPLKAEGDRVREEDAVRWSPLSHEYINRLAQSPFTLDNSVYQKLG